jgi:hypothetical protein
VIYERLATNVDRGLREKTSKDMDFFANGGCARFVLHIESSRRMSFCSGCTRTKLRSLRWITGTRLSRLQQRRSNIRYRYQGLLLDGLGETASQMPVCGALLYYRTSCSTRVRLAVNCVHDRLSLSNAYLSHRLRLHPLIMFTRTITLDLTQVRLSGGVPLRNNAHPLPHNQFSCSPYVKSTFY